MHDVKFRSWDPVNKIMVFPDSGLWSEMDDWIAWEEPEDSPTNRGVHFELMQFTGLTDRNGVDIYEGDLIKNGSARICVVEWNEHLACFDSIVHKDSSTGNSLGFKCREWGGTNGVRVIGNTYEASNEN